MWIVLQLVWLSFLSNYTDAQDFMVYPYAPKTPGIEDFAKNNFLGDAPGEFAKMLPKETLVASKGKIWTDSGSSIDFDCGKMLKTIHKKIIAQTNDVQTTQRPVISNKVWGIVVVQSFQNSGLQLQAYFATSGSSNRLKDEEQVEFKTAVGKVLERLASTDFQAGDKEMKQITQWNVVEERFDWNAWTDSEAVTKRGFSQFIKQEPTSIDLPEDDPIRFVVERYDNKPPNTGTHVSHVDKHWRKGDEVLTSSMNAIGNCAAQKLLTNLYQPATAALVSRIRSPTSTATWKHGLTPGAQFLSLTDVKDHGKSKLVCMAEIVARGTVFVRDWNAVDVEFGADNLVPSCDTCQAFLPSLLAGSLSATAASTGAFLQRQSQQQQLIQRHSSELDAHGHQFLHRVTDIHLHKDHHEQQQPQQQ